MVILQFRLPECHSTQRQPDPQVSAAKANLLPAVPIEPKYQTANSGVGLLNDKSKVILPALSSVLFVWPNKPRLSQSHLQHHSKQAIIPLDNRSKLSQEELSKRDSHISDPNQGVLSTKHKSKLSRYMMQGVLWNIQTSLSSSLHTFGVNGKSSWKGIYTATTRI